MWIESIIMPREDDSEPYVPAPRRDRRSGLAAALEESHKLRDTVQRFVSTHDLSDGVRWLSEPGLLPVITIHCTDFALAKLREAADFVVGSAAPIDVYPALVGTQGQVAPEALLTSAMPHLQRRM
ncbi:hypothetical protein HV824_18285 [Myxococcus sp. AM009]|uniref:hypothetical protein n=1 Tax=unclassified Myxococcus TaxID=2648731 RepID=UPI001595CF83|nr:MULTISPECIES: hypothetical protein [unclassified Myxococcus]NVJ00061.1 hypothetical protein [Myxococcus sp. AM009]NVJ19003.1 hypothetical protein [Myxococcus sp. AM010]